MTDARCLGGANAHNRGRDKRIFAARNVAPNGCNGDQFLAEPDPGFDLNLESLHAVALVPGEARHFVIGVFEIFLERFGQMCRYLANFVRRHAELCVLPIVELCGIAPDRLIAALLNIRKHLPYRVFDRGSVFVGLWCSLL